MTSQEEKAYNKVMSRWNYVNNALNATFKRYNDLENLYFFHTPKSKNSAKSNIFDPMAYEQVEHTVSHLYAQPPKGEFVPIPEGLEDMADMDLTQVLPLMGELMKYQWNRKDADMFRKIATSIRRSAMYGVSWGVMHWRYERYKNDITGNFETLWDDWCYYPLNIYDCFPDIDAQSYKEMEYFIHDEYVTLNDLEMQESFKGEKRYKNLKALKEAVDGKAAKTTVDNPYRNNLMTRRKIDTAGQMEGRIKIRRYYEKDRWITIAPDYAIVLEDGPNMYKNHRLPVLCQLDQDIPGVVLGIGEIDPVRTLMMAMNQFINMRMDNIKMNMERPLLAKKSSVEHLKTWIWKRNNVMIQNQEGDLKLMEVQDVTGNTFIQTLNWLQDIIRTRSGRSDIMTSNRGNRTATEVDAIAEEQNARLRYKVNNLDEFIRDIMVMGMQLNQLFLPNKRWLRIMGIENIERVRQVFAQNPERLKVINEGLAFLNIKKEDILSQYDYIVEAGSTLLNNKSRDMQSLTNALQMGPQLAEMLQMQGKVFDPTPIIKKIFSESGIRDDLIKDINITGLTNGQGDQGGFIPAQSGQQLSVPDQLLTGGTPEMP